ncbi:MAG: CARDB domain-containing protein, partial [Gemmatimonadota bacterium]
MAAPHVTGTAALYVAAHGRDANGDGSIDGADVDHVRSALVAGGIAQTDAACGLSVLDDPDTSPEPIVFGNALNVGGDGSCGGEAAPTPSETDLAITNVAAPAGVVPGAVVDITVTVVNVGGLNVTDDIPVTLVSDNATADPGDDIAIGTRTVAGLPAGFSTNLTFSWNTAGASVGVHTLTGAQGLPDDNASNDAATAAVPLGATLHVGNLDRASTRGSQGGTWMAWVRVTVHDAGDNPLAGATVRGHWDSGFTEEPTCQTLSDGTCEVFLDGIPKKDGNVLFTVDVVSHDGFAYVADANHDDDGNSHGTSIRVFFVNSDDYK